MKTSAYIFIFFILYSISLKGQKKNKAKDFSDIIITGKTIDSNIFKMPNEIQHFSLFIPNIASIYTDAPFMSSEHDLHGFNSKFQKVIHSNSQYTYVNFSIESLSPKSNTNGPSSMYIFEKGDRIDCTISSDYFQFTGKGSDKLNCQSAINNISYKLDSNDQRLRESLTKNLDHYPNLLQYESKKRDSILILQLRIIKNDFAAKIEKKMTEIMITNSYAIRYYDILLRHLKLASLHQNARFKTFIESETYKKIDLNIPEKVSEESLIASPIYANVILTKLILDNLLDKNKEVRELRSKEVINNVFNDIEIKFQGLLRQKLILLFYYKFEASDVPLVHLNKAQTYLTQPEFKSALLQIQETRTRGVSFFQFELEDTNGNLVKLSDFNQSVVVLDFWFTGCQSCRILYERMKPIFEEYRNHPKVKFVTISIDKDKTAWIQSVINGSYTDTNHINLYTNGLGSNHPVITENQITAYPKVYILNKGKIFSAAPPRPGNPSNKKSAGLRADFIALIEEALNSKSIKEKK